MHFVSSSLLPSLLPIPLPYLSEIDHVKSKFQLCIEEEFEKCEKIGKDENPKLLRLCIINSYEVRIEKFQIHNAYDPVLHRPLRIIDLCYNKHNFMEMPDHYVRFLNCLHELYKRHIKRP